MEKKVEVSVLWQIYGKLLTEKQYQFIDYYYNQDLSLSEIAENENITRQAVRDIIKKGERKLFEYEEKLLFMRKTINQEKQIQHILLNLNKIQKDSSDKQVTNILEEVNGDKVTDNEKLRRYELSKKQTLDWNVWVDQPFFPSYAKIDSAEDAYKSVLSDVGCNMPLFDEHDMRIIKEVRTGKCTYTGSIGKLKGIIDDEQDAGGYENYPEETRPADFDTDMDGLPDWWEQMCGTNPNSPKGDFSDANADANGDGYTALEDYLEWMSVPHFYLETGKEKVITLSDFFAGYDKPAYEAACDNMNVEIDGDKLVVPAARSRIRGVVYVDIKATDRAGSFMTRRIGLCVK